VHRGAAPPPGRRCAGGAAQLDLFRFGDAPIFEALHAHRVQIGD
jgi:gentisate 1,2-dioxygenase